MAEKVELHRELGESYRHYNSRVAVAEMTPAKRSQLKSDYRRWKKQTGHTVDLYDYAAAVLHIW
jgi:hypothetical protein